ncbi:hypothetical protein PC129_g20057 [Phytophthora cactorum]|uniref:ATP-dependent DNA helicase n=1 Tax=Phytophthora cactorum TaxID=29920 RepID=A0A8T1H976_9STRA|nr:hypothetical protein Pcac1_g19272 [Phytophthora cactorum]KAG2876317.1 hypothetical protein PC114_g24258 [Phytophthora cactorum]KAG2892159.1 hypothetical protein PC117_g24063 [Phytophthora cactorum]KAG3034703.1 hypothetical protein PC119_g4834 [Phytophthora cactorum]KAG3131257.1 hypothetical protein C6341_g23411 [Phytophthora cactorum]
MTHRYQYETVDRTLQDLLKNDLPFGGIAILLSGDFRQTLPAIPRAGPAEVISASLKRSPLWRDFEFLRLTINMRVQTAQDQSTAQAVQGFADFLLRVGDGRHETCTELGSDYVKIPRDMLLDVSGLETSVVNEAAEQGTAPERLSRLIEKVYSGFDGGNQPDSYFADRIILTPINDDVLAINDMILDNLRGDAEEYRSFESLGGDDGLERQEHGNLYPPEFLNTISLSGMPPHKLKLKVGAPMMLIRNLNTKEGLCNGTRLRVVQLRRNCMKAAIMSGAFAGKEVIIPRVMLISKNSGFPFELRRKQFPVQVAFAMTINKSQGQSIQHLGLFLRNQCFPTGSFMWGCPGLPPEGKSRF